MSTADDALAEVKSRYDEAVEFHSAWDVHDLDGPALDVPALYRALKELLDDHSFAHGKCAAGCWDHYFDEPEDFPCPTRRNTENVILLHIKGIETQP